MVGSLLDGADLARLRAAAAALGGPGRQAAATVLVCLLHGGAFRAAPDGAERRDHDRLVVGGEALAALVGRGMTAAGHAHGGGCLQAPPGRALAVAYGAAAAGRIAGPGARVWCLLDAEACDDGVTWEAARAAAAAAVDTLTAVIVADPPEAGALGALLSAAGWGVHAAVADDPAEVLGALDQALATSARPAAVLAATGASAVSAGPDARTIRA